MAIPEFLVCVNCESPCYVFELDNDEVSEAVCEACGCEEVDQFLSPDDFDAMAGG